MSVKVHEAFSIDSFQDRLIWWDDFLGDQLQDEWNAQGTGSAVVVDAQTGGIIRLTTGGADNDPYRLWWNDIRSLLVTKKVTMETRAKYSATASIDQRIQLWNVWTEMVGFVRDTDIHVNWQIEARTGVGATTEDSGIAADTDYHIYRIECFPTDELHFYIDGVECANSPITTDITTSYLQPFLWVRAREAAIKSMDIDYVVVRQEI